MVIKEQEFPHLFQNQVVKQQKLSKLLDEQDFNSDCETIGRNREDLLKSLMQGIARFTSAKSDPKKLVENLKLEVAAEDSLAEASTASQTELESMFDNSEATGGAASSLSKIN